MNLAAWANRRTQRNRIAERFTQQAAIPAAAVYSTSIDHGGADL
jgi:hypothetical protein